MKVGDVAKTVDELFVGLLADVDNLMATVDGTQSLSGNSGSQQSGGESIQDTTSSTKFNWAGERLKNGGAGTSTQVVTSSKSFAGPPKRNSRMTHFDSHRRYRQYRDMG